MYVQQTWPPHSKQSCIGLCELTNTQTHSIIQPRTSGHHVHTAANVLTVFRPYLMYACGYVSKHMYADMNYTKVRVAVFMKWAATFIRKHTPHSTTYTTRAHTYVRTHPHMHYSCPHTHTIHTHIYIYTQHACTWHNAHTQSYPTDPKHTPQDKPTPNNTHMDPKLTYLHNKHIHSYPQSHILTPTPTYILHMYIAKCTDTQTHTCTHTHAHTHTHHTHTHTHHTHHTHTTHTHHTHTPHTHKHTHTYTQACT